MPFSALHPSLRDHCDSSKPIDHLGQAVRELRGCCGAESSTCKYPEAVNAMDRVRDELAETRCNAALTAASAAEKRRQTADQTVERMTEAFTAAVGLIADGVAWPRDKPGEWLEGLRFPLERDRWHEFQGRYGSGIAWVLVWPALQRFTAAIVAAEERLVPEPPRE